MGAPKPPGLAPEYGAQFGDPSIAAAYPTRPPYPEEIFELLLRLTPTPTQAGTRRVLDLGCGTGDIARRLAPLVDHVDAVDLSAAMIGVGRGLPGGDHPRLRWEVAAAETWLAAARDPYALVVTAESLHWLDWHVVLPRIGALLAPGARLAIVLGRSPIDPPWAGTAAGADLYPLINRYSTNRDYQPYDVVAELARRDLFHAEGRRTTAPVPFRQSLPDFIESWHSRNGLSRDRMPPADAAALDAGLTAIVGPHARDGYLDLQIVAHLVWGRPTIPAPAP